MRSRKNRRNRSPCKRLALLQRMRAESVNAIQTLRETQYRLAAATRGARSPPQRVLASEQRRFEAGTSTTFLVLQRQLDLANTEGRELQAQTALNKAVVELESGRRNELRDVQHRRADRRNEHAQPDDADDDVLPLPPDAQVSPPPPHR